MSSIPRTIENNLPPESFQVSRQSMKVLCAALDALNRGWSILPVRGKYPAADYLPNKEWGPLREVPYTMEQALSIFRHGEGLGLATITGTASGLFVIDVDPRNGGTLEGLDLPMTPTESTPSGGAHYYFRLPDGMTLPSTELFPGVDLLAEGKYAVTAPSAGYSWLPDLSPDDVPLADPPAWLWDSIQPQFSTETSPNKSPATAIMHTYDTSSEYLLVSKALKKTGTDGQTDRGRAPEKARDVTRADVVPITRLRGDTLRQWDSDEAYVRAVCEKLGIPSLPIGKHFCCIIPGHEEKHPSASLWRDRTGAVVYRDWHQRDGAEWYTLAEVYALQAYDAVNELRTANGNIRRLSAPELATWKLRLLVETGFVSPYKIKAQPLPDDAPNAARRVYEGYLLLLGCKWLHTPNEPTSFAWRFAAAWCGDMSKDTAYRGMKWLLERGYVQVVDSVAPRGGGRKMNVFLPGAASHIEQRAKRKDKPSRKAQPKTAQAKRGRRGKATDPFIERMKKPMSWDEYTRLWDEEMTARRGKARSLQKEGLTQHQIAKKMNVSQGTVSRWLKPS